MFNLSKEKKIYHHFCDEISAKMVTFSVRNKNIYKIRKLHELYFAYFPTFADQTLQFY